MFSKESQEEASSNATEIKPNAESGEESFAQGIVPIEAPRHTEQAAFEFMPWHKLRKQVVRDRLWNRCINEFYREWTRSTAPSDDESVQFAIENGFRPSSKPHRFVRGLVLPGNDLLDVRSLLERVSFTPERRLFYLGFNHTYDKSNPHSSLRRGHDSVCGRNTVFNGSKVVADRVENIANTNTLTYRTFINHGPYHFINLDFCGSVFSSPVSGYPSYLDCIKSAIEFQAKNQTAPWLLFVTSEFASSEIDSDRVQAITNLIEGNLMQSEDLVLHFMEIFGNDSCLLHEDRADMPIDVLLDNVKDNNKSLYYAFGFLKWILHLSEKFKNRFILNIKEIFSYPINIEKDVLMLSFGFAFIPVPLNISDATGLTGIPDEHNGLADIPIEEVDNALNALKNIISRVDVIETLSNHEIKESYINAAIKLMCQIGCTERMYREWIETGEVINKS